MKPFFNTVTFIKTILHSLKTFFPLGKQVKDNTAFEIASWNKGSLPRLTINEIFPGIDVIDIYLLRTFDRYGRQSLKYKETLIINTIVKIMQPANIMEIGTYEGNTTLNMAANSPDTCKIITIDLPEDQNIKFALPVPAAYQKSYEPAFINTQLKKNQEYAYKIEQWQYDTATIAWNDLHTTFDIIFIDGCKHPDYVWHDTNKALQKIEGNGGIIIWGNYADNQEVSRIVDEQPKFIKKYAVKDTRLAIGIVERYV